MANLNLRPRCKIINGIRFPAFLAEEHVKEAMSYKATSDDVFICSYPKCGSTWMQNMALYILRKGRELEDKERFFIVSPWIEFSGYEGIYNMPRPGALKTHLPRNLIPYSPDAKYIYVLRNPKDCYVSGFYHLKENLVFGCWDANFDDIFEQFMAGDVPYNDYFEHLKSWETFRNSKQVFFTTYENMKADTTQVILRLASFLGREYVEALEKDNGVLKNILHFTGFDYMKKHTPFKYDYRKITDEKLNSSNIPVGVKHFVLHARSSNIPLSGSHEFCRKGEIGDWKSHLSEEQSERLNQKFAKQTRGTEIFNMYKCFMDK